MNIRSLTRGDGAVIGAALLLFIMSFLKFQVIHCEGGAEAGCNKAPSWSAWSGKLVQDLGSIHLAGVIAAVLIVLGRMQPQERPVAGLTLRQWGTGFAVFSFWASFWAVVSGGNLLDPKVGAILSLVFALVLAAAAVATELVPALKLPLLSAPRPPQPGYGYPGAPGPQGAPAGGYGYPGQGAPYGGAPTPAPGGMAPAPNQGPAPTPGSDFSPFWFAVPVARPIFPEDGSPGAPIAELTPGVWYLAVEQRGQALVAQTQDNRRGILQDTSGIQRG